MKRGDIVIARAPGEFTTKSRPYLVVQTDLTLAESSTITLCPIMSDLMEGDLVRIPVFANDETGLRKPSEIAIDLVLPMRRARIAQTIGSVPPNVMARVEAALRRWLDL